MIILLDLNNTLVENSDEKRKPFAAQIAHERYRQWLVKLVASYHTILMTARPEKYKDHTMDSITRKTGWVPQEAYFNRYSKPPQTAKHIMLEESVFPVHGEKPDQYIAIESNPRTKLMYETFGIPSVKVNENEIWTTLPMPPTTA